jgi:hypothetical protein
MSGVAGYQFEAVSDGYGSDHPVGGALFFLVRPISGN